MLKIGCVCWVFLIFAPELLKDEIYFYKNSPYWAVNACFCLWAEEKKWGETKCNIGRCLAKICVLSAIGWGIAVVRLRKKGLFIVSGLSRELEKSINFAIKKDETNERKIWRIFV